MMKITERISDYYYFYLFSDMLLYTTLPHHHRDKKIKYKGQLCLEHAILLDNTLPNNPYSFKLSILSKDYIFVCKNESNYQQWIYHLTSVISKLQEKHKEVQQVILPFIGNVTFN